MRGRAGRWIARRAALRALSCGLCLGIAAPLIEGSASAEGFRYVDRDGNVHEISVPGGASAAPPPPIAAETGAGVFPHAAAVREAAQLYSLPAELILAVMTVESGFDPRALSPRGAMGLMQLMPATAAEMHVTDPFDPRESTMGGARYLRILLNTAGGDVTVALGSYHAGAGATQRHGGVPPWLDTRRYVASVVRFYRIYQDRGPDYAAVVAAAIRTGHAQPPGPEGPAEKKPAEKKDAPDAPAPHPRRRAPRDAGAPRARGVASPEAGVIHAEGSRARSRPDKERNRPRRPTKRRRGSG